MDGTDSAALTQAGEQLFMTKLLLTAVQCLWMYDYLLTFGDEIKYAWSGRRSRMFVLFVANRYTPMVHLIWVHITMFHYEKPFCQATKWIPIFHSTSTTALAQIAVALRIYAITGKKKVLGGTFALIITAGLCWGIFSIVWIGLGPLQQLPDADLDVFKLCVYKLWDLGELMYYNLAMVFDALAFIIIFVTTKRSGRGRHPGIPSLLDTILRDATHYFMLVFSIHFTSFLFLFVTSAEVQLWPAMANTTVVPIMASRLMLSLKKASVEPKKVWSLGTMTNLSSERSAEGTLRFASRVPSRLRGTSQTPAAMGQEDIELDVTPRLSRSCEPRQAR